jgi:hypothetical protein
MDNLYGPVTRTRLKDSCKKDYKLKRGAEKRELHLNEVNAPQSLLSSDMTRPKCRLHEVHVVSRCWSIRAKRDESLADGRVQRSDSDVFGELGARRS